MNKLSTGTSKILSFTALIALMTATVSLSSTAWAFEFGVVGGYGSSSLTSQNPNPPTSDSYFAGGIFLGSSLFPGFSLETGLRYLPRKQTVAGNVTIGGVSVGAGTQDTQVRYYQIPLLLRMDAIPIISFAAGGYYARGIGNVIQTINGGGLSANSYSGFSDLNYSQTDFGLMGNVRVCLPLVPMLSVLAEASYLYGLTNLDTTNSDSEKWRDIQVMGGFKLSF